MKRIVSGFLSGLALVGLACRALAITSDEDSSNPYEVVANWNAFDLKPIIAAPETNAPPPAPPSKISLQGIQRLFDRKQVLLKMVELGKPGEPPKERPLIMEEGDRRGVLEVVRIDLDNRGVEFKDSGIPVTLWLTNFIAKTPALAPGAVPAPGLPRLPAVPRPVTPGMPPVPAPAAGVGVTTFGGNPAQPNVITPTRPLRTTPLGGSAALVQPPAQQVQLTAEEQIVMMEIERERTKEAVARGDMPPLPPTPLTPGSSPTPAK